MGQITQCFQPPLYWQQFEDLTQAVVRELYGVAHASKVGRAGQAQDGVDVHVSNSRIGEIGVQCKRMDELDDNNLPYPGGVITQKFLEDEASKAISFTPSLSVWILATTAKRDAKIQKWARELSGESRRLGRFEVITWHWDDYIAWLNAFPEVQRWYYDQVIRVPDDLEQDRIILETLALAFDRPALTDPLEHEHVDDFVQALKDVVHAFRTGEHIERRSRHVIRKALGGWREIKTTSWQGSLKEIDRQIGEVRGLVAEGINDGRLKKRREQLHVVDPRLGRMIESKRRKCIHLLNQLLDEANLRPL